MDLVVRGDAFGSECTGAIAALQVVLDVDLVIADAALEQLEVPLIDLRLVVIIKALYGFSVLVNIPGLALILLFSFFFGRLVFYWFAKEE